jgi:hypothetical protein
MRKLVYAFYDKGFSFGRVIKAYPHLRGLLTDCLIGDLFEKDYGELFDAISEFAELPRHSPTAALPRRRPREGGAWGADGGFSSSRSLPCKQRIG